MLGALTLAALAGCGGGDRPDTATPAAAPAQTAARMTAQSAPAPAAAGATITPGTYALKVASSGLCLAVDGGSTADGAKTSQAVCADTAAQHFQLSTEPGGSYRFVNVGSGKSLDVTDVSTANGALIQQWTTTSGDNQRFSLSTSGAGYAIKAVSSGKCMQVKGSKTNTKVGAHIEQWDCKTVANQQWTLLPVDSVVTLFDPVKKDIAMQIVSSNENSSLDWRAQYTYIEDIHDGRGYTAGIIGFCSGTGDMLELIQAYTVREPGNILAKYIPALQRDNGTDSHSGLDPTFVPDWHTAAKDIVFQQSQDTERDDVYFNPAVQQGIADGVHALGQFIYYDAIVMHGPGDDGTSFGGIRKSAMAKAKTPAQGGDETVYLNAFLDARKAAMKTEEAHSDTSRVDTEQRVFLQNGNLDLNTPLAWKVYGESFHID